MRDATSSASASARPPGAPVARRAAAGDLAGTETRLRVLIEPVVAGAGYDLEELAVVRMGRRYVFR